MSGKGFMSSVVRARSAMLSVLLLAVLCPVGAGISQGIPPSSTPPNMPQVPGLNREPEPSTGPTSVRLEHMREDDRRKHLLADTARLVALTSELKEEVDKSTKDELSLDVVRKAAEIEKLAHDVKERMKS